MLACDGWWEIGYWRWSKLFPIQSISCWAKLKRDQWHQNLELEVKSEIPVSGGWSGSKRSNNRGSLDQSWRHIRCRSDLWNTSWLLGRLEGGQETRTWCECLKIALTNTSESNKHKEITFEETYCMQVASPSEMTGLAYDAATNYLVACNRSSVVQLFAIDTMVILRNIFSITIGDYIPRAIAFGPLSGENRNILVFGLHNGEMWVWVNFWMFRCWRRDSSATLYAQAMAKLNAQWRLVVWCEFTCKN